MLYWILNRIFLIINRLYFRNVKVYGKSLIPKNEAKIFISNHPSSFMDPIAAGTELLFPLHFLIAQEFMGPKPIAWILKKVFNLIPIYRPTTRPGELHKNKDTFFECFEAFNQKKSLIIYAEGHSATQRWLDPLQTGTARIIINYFNNHPNAKSLSVVPMGMVYSNPHDFRTDFILNIGKPIQINRENAKNKIELTKQFQQALRKAMLGVPKKEANEMSLVVDAMHQKEYHPDEIWSVISSLDEIDENSTPKKELFEQANRINQTLNQKQISAWDFFRSLEFSWLKLILGGLFLIPAFILNLPAILLLLLWLKVKTYKSTFEGSMKFTIGPLITFSYYLILSIVLSSYSYWFWLIIPSMTVLNFLAVIGYDHLFKLKIKKKLTKNELQQLNSDFQDLDKKLQALK